MLLLACVRSNGADLGPDSLESRNMAAEEPAGDPGTRPTGGRNWGEIISSSCSRLNRRFLLLGLRPCFHRDQVMPFRPTGALGEGGGPKHGRNLENYLYPRSQESFGQDGFDVGEACDKMGAETTSHDPSGKPAPAVTAANEWMVDLFALAPEGHSRSRSFAPHGCGPRGRRGR